MIGRSSLSSAVVVALLLPACSGNVDTPNDQFDPASGDAGGDSLPASTECVAQVSLATPSVVEIRSAEAVTVDVTTADAKLGPAGHPLKVVLKKDGKAVKTLADATAESLGGGALGKVSITFVPNDLGMAPGPYAIEATLGCADAATAKTPATASSTLYAMRLGVTSIAVGDGDGKRVPLMYHAVGGTSGNYYPIDSTKPAASLTAPGDGEADLDDKDGKPRTFADPWSKLDSPPVDAMGAVIEDGTTFPVSLQVGTHPDVTFTLGKTASAGGKVLAGGVAIAGAPGVRLVLDGAKAADAPVTDGASVTFRLDDAPAANVGQYDVTLSWHFEAKGDGGWSTIVGSKHSAKLKVYGVLGNEIGDSAPNLPWIAVVDAATKEIAGKTKDPAEVRKMLVRLVYEDFALTYDRKSGASAYTTYFGGSGWSNARFDLGAFLARSRGNVVNCTDCASILSTYSNMVGSKLHYAIIGWNFSLNPIQGIGATMPGSPFDSGRMSFSYHAVTTPDATKTIDDATLAVDGDGDPTMAPFDKKLVQDIAGPEYLHRLSPGTPEYQYADQVTTVR